MPPRNRLPFESDIYELEELLERLEAGSNGQLGSSEESAAFAANWSTSNARSTAI